MHGMTARAARIALVLTTLGTAAACGARTAATSSGEVSHAAARARDRIAIAEIDGASSTMTALEMIQRLRPEFLGAPASWRRSAVDAGPATSVVYVDGLRWGSPETLRAVAASRIADVRRVPRAEARMRYGMDAPASVIEVRLLRAAR